MLLAIHKPVTDAGAILISPNAGPSSSPARAATRTSSSPPTRTTRSTRCSGKYAQDRGYKRVYLLAPNYQAGKDSLAGFKRHFKGEIVEEIYVPLNTLDFQSELAKIAAAKPDAIFTFMPGGMGVNLVKQYRQAGLADASRSSPPSRSTNRRCRRSRTRRSASSAARTGRRTSTTPQNKAFVAAYEKAYNSVPGTYAMQAYDAAMLIDSALKATGGKTDDKDALCARR